MTGAPLCLIPAWFFCFLVVFLKVAAYQDGLDIHIARARSDILRHGMAWAQQARRFRSLYLRHCPCGVSGMHLVSRPQVTRRLHTVCIATCLTLTLP